MKYKKSIRRKFIFLVWLIAQILGLDLQTNNAAYGVSKAALNAFTKDLSMELGAFHIRVNAVALGGIDG